MNKWIRASIQVLAVLFFLIGLMFLPFGVWLDEGPNPIFSWTIFILSVGTPWAIGYWLARVGFRNHKAS
jgi:hypothetical protein